MAILIAFVPIQNYTSDMSRVIFDRIISHSAISFISPPSVSVVMNYKRDLRFDYLIRQPKDLNLKKIVHMHVMKSSDKSVSYY